MGLKFLLQFSEKWGVGFRREFNDDIDFLTYVADLAFDKYFSESIHRKSSFPERI